MLLLVMQQLEQSTSVLTMLQELISTSVLATLAENLTPPSQPIFLQKEGISGKFSLQIRQEMLILPG